MIDVISSSGKTRNDSHFFVLLHALARNNATWKRMERKSPTISLYIMTSAPHISSPWFHFNRSLARSPSRWMTFSLVSSRTVMWIGNNYNPRKEEKEREREKKKGELVGWSRADHVWIIGASTSVANFSGVIVARYFFLYVLKRNIRISIWYAETEKNRVRREKKQCLLLLL